MGHYDRQSISQRAARDSRSTGVTSSSATTDDKPKSRQPRTSQVLLQRYVYCLAQAYARSAYVAYGLLLARGTCWTDLEDAYQSMTNLYLEAASLRNVPNVIYDGPDNYCSRRAPDGSPGFATQVM